MRRSAFYFDVSKLDDGELADLIHELNDELDARLSARPRGFTDGWLKRQLDEAALSVRSWSSNQQRNYGVKRR